MSAPTTTGSWPLIHAERAALAEDLASLTDAQWATRSLCSDFTVEEVLAHLVAGATMRFPKWMAGVIGHRFDFEKQVAMRTAEYRGATSAETLDRFRRAVPRTTTPLGNRGSVVGWLAETVVHAEDIRRPLGVRREYPIDVLTAVAGYHAGTDMVVPAKGRIGGLRLEATDGPFATGSGELATGPTLALIMAMTGRGECCDDLTGPGVPVLRARCGR